MEVTPVSKKQQKKKKKGASVQELLGVKTFSDYGIVTHRGELLYYLVTPTNISVLSQTKRGNEDMAAHARAVGNPRHRDTMHRLGAML